MLSGGLQIELSDCEAESVTLKGDYLWQVLEIVIQVIPTILEVHWCACSHLSAECYYMALYQQMYSTQWDIM